jgi:ANTH domain
MLYATRRGTRLLNLSDFRDEAHSASWEQSTFVRTYSLFLDQRLEFLQYDAKTSTHSNSGSHQRSPKDRWDDNYSDPYTTDPYNRSPNDEQRGGSTSNGIRPMTPVRDMKPEKLIGRMHQLQQLLDRFLACRPTGAAKHNRLILISLYPIIKDSFQIYADICEVLAALLDRFFDMDYQDCVKAFEAHVSVAKQIDELIAFYGWCKDVGVARSSEYPEVQRITDKLLESLEEFVRDRAKRAKSPPKESKPEPPKLEEPQEPDMNSIKALPAPESKPEPVKVETEVKNPTPAPQPAPAAPVEQPALVDLREDNNTADEQGNKLALALFSGPPASTKGEWEAFPSDKDEVTSAWQTPAAEPGKADWELALVETASNLSKQKASLGGRLDPLLLNGMYDQGIVRQHVSGQAGSVGSASSVALPGPSQAKNQILALPAPDGSVQTVGGDPFAASLSVPPPAYVQMAEVEKKQQLLVQEQMLWQQYQQTGMQGQASLNKLSNNGYGYMQNPAMPYGMPMGYHPMGGYYNPTF